MSSRVRNPYVRGSVGVPDALLAVFALILWTVWPSDAGKITRSRFVSKTSFVYRPANVVDAGGFDLPDMAWSGAPASPSGSRAQGDVLNVLATRPVHKPKLLDPTEVEFVQAERPALAGIRDVMPGGFRIDSSAADAAAPGLPAMSLTVSQAPVLVAQGFQMPDLKFTDAKALEKPWMVAVFIDVAEDGRVEHVFLDSSCGDRKIDSVVLSAAHRGTCITPRGAVSGRIVVNNGSQ